MLLAMLITGVVMLLASGPCFDAFEGKTKIRALVLLLLGFALSVGSLLLGLYKK